MTIAEWMTGRRTECKLSRRNISDVTNIKNGRVYAIEKGMGRTVSADELVELERLLGPYDGERADTQGETTQPAVASVPSDTTTAPVEPVETIDKPVAPVANGIDWTHLRSKSETVSPHDLERAIALHGANATLLGPDPNAGYRLFSNSEMRTFEECQRRWYLGWYLGLRLRQQSPLGALAIGNRIHRALQAWYTPDGIVPLDPKIALERCITNDWTTLVRTYGEESIEIARFSKDFNTEANLERAMISGYMEWLEETGADTELSVVSAEMYIEAVLELPPGYPDTKIIGKLDVRLTNRLDGVRRFMDHKTVMDLTTPVRNLPLDVQMKHYHLLELLNTTDNDERCGGAIYNMLRKVKRTAAAKPPFYGRAEVRHNPHTIENYRKHVARTVVTIHDTERLLVNGVDHHDVVVPTPSRDCHWKCPFVAVCSMIDDGSRSEAMLHQLYTKGEPLDYYMKDVTTNIE
jgi:hypothetical protein